MRRAGKLMLSLISAGVLFTGCSKTNQANNNVTQANGSNISQAETKTFFNASKSSIFKAKTEVTSSSDIKALSNVKKRAVTNFKHSSRQWHLRTTKASKAWEYTQGNKDLIVAVIDTGVDYNHPALEGRVIKAPDFADNDLDPMDDGNSGHGTHVAGIIAANGDAMGMAPNVKIMALKVFPTKSQGAGSRPIADAIIHAVENGASIVNMSLGSASMRTAYSSREVQSALTEAAAYGVTVITAAGNSTNGFVSSQPSVQQNIYQIPVIATNERGTISTFSNYSNLDHPKAISAPGVNIYSSIPIKQVCGQTRCSVDPYKYMDGTSMAAPVVAGAMALVKSAMYDDYLRVIEAYKKKMPWLKPFTIQEFFHTRNKQAMQQLGLSLPPSELAQHLLFSYTNKDNGYARNQAGMVYGAKRDAVFGFGIINAGDATEGASRVFSSVFLQK